MKVKAIELGYYNEKRRRPNGRGSIFTLKKLVDFSPVWMRIVSCTDKEKTELKKTLEDKRKAPKGIKFVNDHLFVSGEAVTKERFDDLFDKPVLKDEREEVPAVPKGEDDPAQASEQEVL